MSSSNNPRPPSGSKNPRPPEGLENPRLPDLQTCQEISCSASTTTECPPDPTKYLNVVVPFYDNNNLPSLITTPQGVLVYNVDLDALQLSDPVNNTWITVSGGSGNCNCYGDLVMSGTIVPTGSGVPSNSYDLLPTPSGEFRIDGEFLYYCVGTFWVRTPFGKF